MESSTSLDGDIANQAPLYRRHVPVLAHVSGYRMIDPIGSPDPPLLRHINDDGETESCSTTSCPPPAHLTPPVSPVRIQEEGPPSQLPDGTKSDYKISLFTHRMLYLTELPFLIMWTYATYWIYLVVMYAHLVRTMIWLSAAVASILVGIGLNANAYEMLSGTARVDYGVVSRFFIIPFGVSSLSGMTNQLRERFLLVFPRDPVELLIAVLLPALVVSLLFSLRILILSQLPVPWNFRIVFLNTGQIKDLKRGKSLIQRIRSLKPKGKRNASPEEVDLGKTTESEEVTQSTKISEKKIGDDPHDCRV